MSSVCIIRDYVNPFRDRSDTVNYNRVSIRRIVAVYDAIINSDSLNRIITKSESAMIAYDESYTYIAMQFPRGFQCLVTDLRIDCDNTVITPRIKGVYESQWGDLLIFMNEWNKWNQPDTVRLKLLCSS